MKRHAHTNTHARADSAAHMYVDRWREQERKKSTRTRRRSIRIQCEGKIAICEWPACVGIHAFERIQAKASHRICDATDRLNAMTISRWFRTYVVCVCMADPSFVLCSSSYRYKTLDCMCADLYVCVCACRRYILRSAVQNGVRLAGFARQGTCG